MCVYNVFDATECSTECEASQADSNVRRLANLPAGDATCDCAQRGAARHHTRRRRDVSTASNSSLANVSRFASTEVKSHTLYTLE